LRQTPSIAVLSLLVCACAPRYNVIALEDEENSSVTETDPANYDNATLRIVRPLSGSFVPYREAAPFEAELLDSEGNPLDFDAIEWTSNSDPSWTPTGLSFDDDTLDVGLHSLTAEVSLPNGDRLAYSAGGILVQSVFAGTYVGTFSADVQYDSFPLGCGGSAVLVIDPYGEVLTGDSDCLVQLGGFDAPLAFVFDVEHDGNGGLSGTTAADLFGWFQLDFETSGEVDLDSESLSLEFAGAPWDGMTLDGSVTADRISLDSGL